MPLRKLWNSICGKTTGSAAEPISHPVGDIGPKVSKTPAKSPSPSPASQAPSQASAQAPVSRPATFEAVKSLRGSATRDDKKLFRRIEALGVNSVLEVTLGDGRRSLAMLEQLTHKGHSTPLHYIAIDEFELGGGELLLRDFHRHLREYPAKVQLVPMPIDSGLDRVVRTFGQVDLILWAADQPPTAAQMDKLARLSKTSTVLVTKPDGRWSEARATVQKGKKAA